MKTMMLRNSERSSWKTCRHRWNWTWNAGRQAAMAPYALRFGDLVHQALAAYYIPGRRRGPVPAGTFERLYHEQATKLGDDGFDVYADEKWVKALDLGVGMLEGYVRRYADEDEDYEVISSEQTFQLRIRVPAMEIPLSEPSEPAAYLLDPAFTFTMVGTFDGVWRYLRTNEPLFKEFKTATAITDDGLSMDEQASLYWTYGPKFLRRAGLIGPDEKIKKILYTRLRKAIPDPDAVYNDAGLKLNKDKSVSKVQPKPYFSRVPVYRDPADRARLHERVLAEAREIRRARSGSPLAPTYKNPGPLHMPNCRGCTVREACEVHEAGGDWKSVLAATTTRWNPYESHELPERV